MNSLELDHPYIIKTIDHGFEGCKIEAQNIGWRGFIEMEYADGPNLLEFLVEHKEAFGENERIGRYYFKQMISALTYIHE